MKLIFSISSLLLFFTGTFAQNFTQTVRGTVIDKESKEPLTGATVSLLNSNPVKGTATDINGNFRLEKVPVGRQSIKVIYVGYKEIILPDVIVNSAKEVVLNIEMEEVVVMKREVVVKANAKKNETNNDLVTVSGRSFTIDQTQRYAGSLGDPSRMASNFAGVAGGGSDQRNDIVIRGNSPLGLLWRLEGADIPNPNHFSSQGANGGPVSILNNNTLANSDFLTGAFPAEYGNANSGVFDLKMRNGNNEKFEFLGQMGFSGVELMGEGPLNKKKGSSFLLSYRYSTLAVFDAVGFKFGNAGIPQYQDISFKFYFPQTKIGSLSLFGIGGNSATQLLDSKKTPAEMAKLAFPLDIDYSSRMGVTGISHLVRIGKTSFVKTVFTISGEGNDVDIDSLNYLNNYNGVPIQYRRTATTRESLHSYFSKKIDSRNAFKLGIIVTTFQLNMKDTAYNARLGRYKVNYDINEGTGLLQAYANYNFHVNEKITLNAGLHYNRFLLNASESIEPRAGIKWKVTQKQTWGLGFGSHGQNQPLPVYFQKTLIDTGAGRYIFTNKNLKMTRSLHYVLSYENQLGANLYLKSEVYYQQLSKIPVSRNPSVFSVANFGADFVFPDADSLVNKGEGRNYGAELTLERFFADGYYFLVTASVFNSEYKGGDGVWRNTAFNGNYVFNALAGRELKFKKGGILTFSLKVTDAGGKRYTPVDIIRSAQEGKTVYVESRTNELKYKDYFRTDIRVGFKKNGKKITQEWALDIQNVFNTQNILTQQYNLRTGKVEKQYQIGIFPVPLYRIYF
ncbi:MAG: TonB-dependent receptor [Bacteroidia bacterium]|nr:TonB-dependent receptor [Bacteroidia bacterium]